VGVCVCVRACVCARVGGWVGVRMCVSLEVTKCVAGGVKVGLDMFYAGGKCMKLSVG